MTNTTTTSAPSTSSYSTKASQQIANLTNPAKIKALGVSFFTSISLFQIWLPTFIMLVLFFTPQSSGPPAQTGGGKRKKEEVEGGKTANYSFPVLVLGSILTACLVYREYT